MSNHIKLRREQLVSEYTQISEHNQGNHREVLQAKIMVTITDGHSKVMNMIDIGEITAIMEDANSRLADAVERCCNGEVYRNPLKLKTDES